MYTPFLPFIVSFSRVLKSRDANDLVRIERFAASLRPAEPAWSSMLQRLFQLLYETARLYVVSKANPAAPDLERINDEFNSHLSELGFAMCAGSDAVNSAQAGADEEEANGEDGEAEWLNVQQQQHQHQHQQHQQQHPLGDWYRDNQDMMGLLDLDEDLFVDEGG